MFEDISKVLLITDMDGTFLPASKIPTPKTLAAVKRFEEAGGRFSIATGRAIQAARQYFDMVNVNCPIIMSNGGMVYDIHTKEQIYNVFLPSFAADIVKEILADNPYVGCEVLTVNEVYVPSMTPMESAITRSVSSFPFSVPLTRYLTRTGIRCFLQLSLSVWTSL